MAEFSSDPSASRRRDAQRQRQRRATQKRIVTGALITVIVVLAALWFSDTLRIPTDGPTLAGGAVSDKPAPTIDTNPVTTETPHRALTSDAPLKLWIGGDSLAGALGPALGEMTGATGVVQPQYDSRVGSGLMDGVGDINWLEHAQEQMDELTPEAVVFIIGTNDANAYDASQSTAYAQLTEQMMRILIGPGAGREVYWVNAPVMRDSDLEENVLKVDEIQRSVATMFPQVTFIDAHTLFADETGEYQSSLPDDTGKTVTMRAGDGIHFTGDGAKHLAQKIFGELDSRWKILAQAVPGQQKDVLVTKGSTQVSGNGGSSSGNSSNNSSNSNSSSNNGSGGSSNANGATESTTSTTTAVVIVPPPPPPSSTTPTTTSTPSTPPST
jgi:uncharacterized protein